MEFNKRENADKNGDEMVDLLISVVLEVLLDKYSIQGNMEWVVELDSSTEGRLTLNFPSVGYYCISSHGWCMQYSITYYKLHLIPLNICIGIKT